MNPSASKSPLHETSNSDLLNSPDLDNVFPSRSCLRRIEDSPVLQKLLRYPATGSFKLRPTSWLDGLRGVAALEVYIFHALGCWANIVPAWHADEEQTHIMQMPMIRTFFASGGAAVSVFFAISGYVLTQKSLRWIREGTTQQLYTSVKSSMFRRGFRLYLPPILLTFIEMLATRFGIPPPLNFNFVPEPTLAGQFMDWLSQTNRWANPFMHIFHGIFHNEYEQVIWTIPLEFYGSFVCYGLVLILARIPGNLVRMVLVGVLGSICMFIGAWHLTCFIAGMMIADFHLSQEESGGNHSTKVPSSIRKWHTTIWSVVCVVGFYIGGLPALWLSDAYLKPMPGFETLLALTPKSLSMTTQDSSRFWWTISGVSLVISISQLPRLKGLFESKFCQYLGKISFSLYLIHEFCLVLFGLTLKKVLMQFMSLDVGVNGGFTYWFLCVIWLIIFTFIIFGLAAQVEKWVDAPTVRFSKWLEGHFSRITQKSFRRPGEARGANRDYP